mmetsp:Transcript_8291/g.11755  ORF Transcript_8291/g.11755 Transcript_8291/m.11755 type:complete len:774 (+) Transcript_8291:68-2389(+)|eukprot:CAMPEP_0184478170 /NCGR_PEP_ID=MMETSP0113_2-20130426/266_1 /TAXON_ID=91329 /ORGANISM="Norrisiella sphaerica, Strain BC52" /LENGTH=773 /DNA_ID=CAMNT_0026855859 /DNA_START=45 /DNA_END=2366 /DNA_ORIENTATION=-
MGQNLGIECRDSSGAVEEGEIFKKKQIDGDSSTPRNYANLFGPGTLKGFSKSPRVATPYGCGVFLHEDDNMATVKLPFGVANMQKDMVMLLPEQVPLSSPDLEDAYLDLYSDHALLMTKCLKERQRLLAKISGLESTLAAATNAAKSTPPVKAVVVEVESKADKSMPGAPEANEEAPADIPEDDDVAVLLPPLSEEPREAEAEAALPVSKPKKKGMSSLVKKLFTFGGIKASEKKEDKEEVAGERPEHEVKQPEPLKEMEEIKEEIKEEEDVNLGIAGQPANIKALSPIAEQGKVPATLDEKEQVEEVPEKMIDQPVEMPKVRFEQADEQNDEEQQQSEPEIQIYDPVSAYYWSAFSVNVASKAQKLSGWKIQVQDIQCKGKISCDGGKLKLSDSSSSLFGGSFIGRSMSMSDNSSDIVGVEDTEKPYIVATVCDRMGNILGSSAQTPAGDINEPIYIIRDPNIKVKKESVFVFIQLKKLKVKRGGIKTSDICFAFVDTSALDESTNATLDLTLYKKPLKLNRDMSALKNQRLTEGSLTIAISACPDAEEDEKVEEAEELKVPSSLFHWSALPVNMAEEDSALAAFRISLLSVSYKGMFNYDGKRLVMTSSTATLFGSSTMSRNMMAVEDEQDSGVIVMPDGWTSEAPERPYFVITVVDKAGNIIGQPGQVTPGGLIESLYLMKDSAEKVEKGTRYVFITLKKLKAKAGGAQTSEIAFSFFDATALEDTEQIKKLTLYKKPTSFNRDSRKLYQQKTSGFMTLRIENCAEEKAN